MYNINTPQIYIACESLLSHDKINEIEYGIEEEGLFSKRVGLNGDIHFAASAISRNSTIGVCVAVNRNCALLTYEKCDPEHPVLFYLLKGAPLHFFRNLGKNAARFVKGLPFV